MARVALVDGDVLVYKAAWAGEQGIEWGDGIHTLHADAAVVRDVVDTILGAITSAVKPDSVIITLSDHITFRHALYPAYKANRKAVRKPIAYRAARAYLEGMPNVVCRPLLEADDVMGIISTGETKYASGRDERVVCSVDKDMRQVPGLHYDWTKDDDVRVVSLLDADAFFYAQCLAGDSTDGIPGIKGVGMVTASKMLAASAEQHPWDAILAAYEKAGHDAEFALTMARLVRILRAEDYNFPKKEALLWQPPAH